MLPVSFVVTPCSGTKARSPTAGLQAEKLQSGPQEKLSSQWLMRLARGHPETFVASDLYSGRAFLRARSVAEECRAGLLIASAGLGLLRGETAVPSYDLTVSPSAPRSVLSLVRGGFDASKWWHNVLRSPYSTPDALCAEPTGRILIALSKPYAALVGPWLDGLPTRTIHQMRLFGAGLSEILPARLAKQCIKYDVRLDNIIPGTAYEFASRALAHFGKLICATSSGSNVRDDQRCVDFALLGVPAPPPLSRRRLGDREIIAFIRSLAGERDPTTRLLTILRREHSVACGEERFQRLLAEARA